jgi:hypothetical protein
MMKPDTDIDTEKYSSHNIHNTMIIKTFPDPGNMKNMGNCVFKKKVSNYTFPPKNCTFPPKNCTFPTSK